MQSQQDFERRWALGFAHKVLTIPSGCVCDDDIARPGFIGPEYAKGRILIVGSIHHERPLRESGIYGILPDVRAFRQSPSGPMLDRYVTKTQDGYLRAIPSWTTYNTNGRRITNTVWSRIQTLLNALGANTRQIAFTNLAKCALPSGVPDLSRIRKHNLVTPLLDLIDMLEPDYVLIAKEQKGLPTILGLDGLSPSPRYCDNMHFTSGGVPFAVWRAEDARGYRAIRG